MRAIPALCLLGVITGTAAADCETRFNDDVSANLIRTLDGERQKLRDIRALVAEDGELAQLPEERRAAISKTTHRLEYWSKDFARYVRKYAATDPEAVCARLTGSDSQYMADFLVLTWYASMPNIAPVRFEDYK